MTVPSVGRVVHYVARGSADGKFPKACRAADVTEVPERVNQPGGTDWDLDTIGLMVKNPTGIFFHSLADGGVPYDGSEDPAGGTWHWPERA